jgi:hypothetical protein
MMFRAARVFRISPPSEGSKSTRQTSPRSLRPTRRGICNYALGPFQRVPFTLRIEGHLTICRAQALVLALFLPIAKPLGDAPDILQRQAVDGFLDFFQLVPVRSLPKAGRRLGCGVHGTGALPNEHAVTIALRTQQVLAYESGVTNTAAGRQLLSGKANARYEQAANAYIRRIDEMGGMIPAIETGYPQSEIAAASYRYRCEVESASPPLGVNKLRFVTFVRGAVA